MSCICWRLSASAIFLLLCTKDIEMLSLYNTWGKSTGHPNHRFEPFMCHTSAESLGWNHREPCKTTKPTLKYKALITTAAPCASI